MKKVHIRSITADLFKAYIVAFLFAASLVRGEDGQSIFRTVANQERSNTHVLVIDVYSGKMAGDMDKRMLSLWIRKLKTGPTPTAPPSQSRIIHEEYPLGQSFDISKEAEGAEDEDNVIMGLAQQRYVKSHRILANCLGVKDFRLFRNSQDGTWFSRSVLGA